MGQPIFQMKQNQYQEQRIERWEHCYYYQMTLAMDGFYLPTSGYCFLWNQTQKKLYDFSGADTPMQVGTVGDRCFGLYIHFDYLPLYKGEELERWFMETGQKIEQQSLTHCRDWGMPGVIYCTGAPLLLRYGIAQMESSAGCIAIESIAPDIGYTARQLERQCKMVYGCTPKQMCSRIRMYHAIQCICKYPEYSNVMIAEHYGFADTSHFQREFKKYMGMTPKEFRAGLT